MAGGTGELLLPRIEFVLAIKIIGLMIQRPPHIGVTFRTIDKPLHLDGMFLGDAAGIRTGKNAEQEHNAQW